ncbi:MAG TPA: SDR family NAD(P)-dependent oxidoreductase [Acidimicrobiia bacterium]|nr:SDR family NAD(P)-dependent oxidoreductase [Acidimicrobiia bacterium]
MTGALEGRRVLVTGAGRGMGREHARLFAAEGARVVVNDTGVERDGTGHDPSVVGAIAAELTDAGAEVLASDDDVATMAGAEAAVATAVDAWGGLDVVVNNAGILRDRMFVNMTEDEWDAVIRGHLKSTFCTTRVAAGRWRDRTKAGDEVHAAVVNVSSTSGLMGAVGQSNYGAAKAGIAAMTVILAEELGRYGVRCNAIVPVARTRMTEEVAGIADVVRAPDDPAEFDVFHPAHVAPVVAWLATEACPVTGRVLYVRGGEVRLVEGWHYVQSWEHGGPTSIAEVDAALGAMLAGESAR